MWFRSLSYGYRDGEHSALAVVGKLLAESSIGPRFTPSNTSPARNSWVGKNGVGSFLVTGTGTWTGTGTRGLLSISLVHLSPWQGSKQATAHAYASVYRTYASVKTTHRVYKQAVASSADSTTTSYPVFLFKYILDVLWMKKKRSRDQILVRRYTCQIILSSQCCEVSDNHMRTADHLEVSILYNWQILFWLGSIGWPCQRRETRKRNDTARTGSVTLPRHAAFQGVTRMLFFFQLHTIF